MLEGLKVLNFMYGAIMVGCLGIGLFFLKFWHKTGDRFFAYFAAAFGLLAIERVLFLLVDSSLDLYSEVYTRVFVARLLAFLLITAAILEKNRKKS
jgi:hypothetical protein